MGIPCVISLEANEALFSLAIRHCRLSDVELRSLLKDSRVSDRTGFRDFPIAANCLETAADFKFSDYESLLTHHSSATYFATTLPEPFRSMSLARCIKTADSMLRTSMGSSWPHLRFCRTCANSEFGRLRYSWWHRDHQLPLQSFCTIHERPLDCIHLNQIGLRLPHEFCEKGYAQSRQRDWPTELERIVSRIELELAAGQGRGALKAQYKCIARMLSSISLDYVEQAELVQPGVQKLILALRDRGVREPSSYWEDVRMALLQLLHNGFDYSDVVIVVMLSVALTYPLSFGWDSLPKDLQDVWRHRNSGSDPPFSSC